MAWPGPIEQVDELGREVYQHGLGARGRTASRVSELLDEHYEEQGHCPPTPHEVSAACRRLVELGWAEQTARGYRRRAPQQQELGHV